MNNVRWLRIIIYYCYLISNTSCHGIEVRYINKYSNKQIKVRDYIIFENNIEFIGK